VTANDIDALVQRIHVPIPVGEVEELEVNAYTYMRLCRAALMLLNAEENDDRLLQTMFTLMYIGGVIVAKGTVPGDDVDRMEFLVNFLVETAHEQQWKSDVDPVLSLCYNLLADRAITRQESYLFARALLGPNAPKSAASWRVRVNNFVKDRGLEPIGQPIRRPPQNR
jgi:hypothetical protein